MDFESSILRVGFLAAIATLIAVIVARGRSRPPADGRVEAPKKARRVGGSSWLVLQEFVDPRAGHVEQVRHERKDDVDPSDGGDDDLPEAALRSGLLASLGESPIDPDEIRRHLAAAHRAGLDWRQLYDEAVRAVLADQPYRAPSLPPPGRVAPRIASDD